ncbi:uncharacterized protein TNCV_2670871 [Trichonephila clavipes]|nr:uncharacterized protein TNCV_2670871 [Trichonephila clavipes]
MTETVTSALADHQSKLGALVSERDSLPQCLTFNCQYCVNRNPATPVVENAPVQISKTKYNKDKNATVTPVNTTSKNKNKFKKRKLKNDSVEDFVFPKKTARPASPSISEPVAITNSFSDLEEDKNQVIEEQAKTADVPIPKSPQPIHLKIKDNFRTRLKLIYQHFPEITNKNSGKFLKLFTKDIDEKHKITNFLESDKDFEFFCVKPKTEKPIKVVIKGLPIFTKTQEIHSDLEEEGFAVEKTILPKTFKLKSLPHAHCQHPFERLGSLSLLQPAHWSLLPKLRPPPSTRSQHQANYKTR